MGARGELWWGEAPDSKGRLFLVVSRDAATAVMQRVLVAPGTTRVRSALAWAELVARLRARGRAMRLRDSMIVATALVHGLTVVTRSSADFEAAGVGVLDPFAG